MLEDTLDSRAEKAQRVKALAFVFINCWTKAVSAQDVPLYFHIVSDHVPQMILDHGDMGRFCTENLEHIHAIRGRDARQGSNKRLGGTKRSRLAQTFELEVVRVELGKLVPTNDTSRHKQQKNSKKRRAVVSE
jgi:hypothetical protein